MKRLMTYSEQKILRKNTSHYQLLEVPKSGKMLEARRLHVFYDYHGYVVALFDSYSSPSVLPTIGLTILMQINISSKEFKHIIDIHGIKLFDSKQLMEG